MTTLGERPLRTAVVGGGPGGLFYAAVAKRRFPAHDVVVYERNPPDATFGFGVVFSERTLSGLAAVYPELHADIERASIAWEDIEIRRDGRRLRCGGHGFSAISRRTLLALLRRRALAAGADLRFEREMTPEAVADADLVIAADGVNSTLRNAHAAALRPRMAVGAARYIWFATRQPFDALTFIFAADQHGQWGVHAYPFEDGTSTFIVETDEATWRRAGLDAARDLAPGESDLASLRFCERLFEEHLGGHGLLENNSKWLRFRTLRCGAWHRGNVVLIGDAAHTAHFSVGSGTKMAMEDAAALADAVAAAHDVPEALAAYERVRRPPVERIQAAAEPSIAWWERFHGLARWPDEQFAFHFLTRSPPVTRARLRARDPRFIRGVDRWHAETTGGAQVDGPLAAPFELGPLQLPSRLVVAARPTDDPLVHLAGAAAAGAGLVLAPPAVDAGPAFAWVRENTAAAVGVVLANGSVPEHDVDVLAADLANGSVPEHDVDVLAAGLAAASRLGAAWPAERPLLVRVTADGAASDHLLADIAALATARLLIVAVAGTDPVAQLLLCDRLRQEVGVATLLVGVPGADAAATAIVAGRADLVQTAPSLVSQRWLGA